MSQIDQPFIVTIKYLQVPSHFDSYLEGPSKQKIRPGLNGIVVTRRTGRRADFPSLKLTMQIPESDQLQHRQVEGPI
jgi:hypothetical protein